MSDKDKNRAISRLLKYLRRDLFGHDMHDFERDIEADPFTRDAIDGYRELTPDEAKQDLYALQISITKRIKRRRRITIYSVAATLAALMVVSTLFVKLSDFSPEKARNQATREVMGPPAYEDDINDELERPDRQAILDAHKGLL